MREKTVSVIIHFDVLSKFDISPIEAEYNQFFWEKSISKKILNMKLNNSKFNSHKIQTLIIPIFSFAILILLLWNWGGDPG